MSRSPSTNRARELRRNDTDSERRLWSLLRGQQFGVRFRRQYPLGPYFLDFYAPAIRLVIEIDGGQHSEPNVRPYDVRRTKFLEAQGCRVLRFWNADVLLHGDTLIDRIWSVVSEILSESGP